MQPYPPLGTLYAAALLRQHGFSVALFDTMLEDPALGFPAALRRHQPRVVAVYEDGFNYLSKMCLSRMREVAYEMAKAAREVGARVVTNGSDASDHTEEYLHNGFEFVLQGEAEWTLLELVQSLLHGVDRDPEDIEGLTFIRPKSGKLVWTPSRPLMRDLDALPLPARDLIDVEPYRAAWKSAHGFFSLNLVASRGCPYRCNWCTKPFYGNAYLQRSATSLAEEINQLKEHYGAEHLWFADDIFGLRPRWITELATEVERRGAVVPFKMQTRMDLITPENVHALRRAGATEVWLGVESGSQRILDAMDKDMRVEELVEGREILRQHGVRACFFLQFGYPGETWEDIQRTIQLVRRTLPNDIGVSVSYPLPRTIFYERVRKELGEKTNWVDSDDLAVMFRGSYTNEFYRALRDALHAEVEEWNGAGNGNPQVVRPSSPVSEYSQRVSSLWERVERLEKTCRNDAPTLSSSTGRSDETS